MILCINDTLSYIRARRFFIEEEEEATIEKFELNRINK